VDSECPGFAGNMSIALLPLSSDDQFRTTAYGGFINVVFMEWYKVKEWYWNGKGRERGWERGVTTPNNWAGSSGKLLSRWEIMKVICMGRHALRAVYSSNVCGKSIFASMNSRYRSNSFLCRSIQTFIRAIIDVCICETRDSDIPKVLPISFIVISS
jgi:hypothetical protein